MNFYKVAAVTCSQRVEWADRFTDYNEAQKFFYRVCTTCDQMPINAICLLEYNALVLEAYRFSDMNDAYTLDNNEVMCPRDTLTRRTSFAGARFRPDSGKFRGAQKLNSSVIFQRQNRQYLNHEMRDDFSIARQPLSLVERICTAVLSLACIRPIVEDTP